MKKYHVYLSYTGYIHHEVDAEDEEAALEQARSLPFEGETFKTADFLGTLEEWEDGHMVEADT